MQSSKMPPSSSATPCPSVVSDSTIGDLSLLSGSSAAGTSKAPSVSSAAGSDAATAVSFSSGSSFSVVDDPALQVDDEEEECDAPVSRTFTRDFVANMGEVPPAPESVGTIHSGFDPSKVSFEDAVEVDAAERFRSCTPVPDPGTPAALHALLTRSHHILTEQLCEMQKLSRQQDSLFRALISEMRTAGGTQKETCAQLAKLVKFSKRRP